MRQVIQSYRTGDVTVRDVPAPRCPRNGLLVRNCASLISIGTERGMIELGRKSLLGKARARPDLARRALEKAKKEGFWKVFQDSLARLDTPVGLGYSAAGTVVEVGDGVHEYAPGDRVAVVGANIGSHAEYLSVPINMACRISDELSFEEAAFGMVGAISMHGVREAKLTFGSTVVVLGLGLLGLLCVQMLRAYGCRVLAMDVDPSKLAVAEKLGAKRAVVSMEDLTTLVAAESGGHGADAVIITAATNSAVPIDNAITLSRDKGRIVLVGVADIHPARNEMWLKEVEIIVSRAGGAGALDPLYELDGIDYPIGYARWTQTRNVEEFLRLAADGLIDLKSLVTHRYGIDEAQAVYQSVVEGSLKGAIGIVLQYHENAGQERVVKLPPPKRHEHTGDLKLGVVGAGQFGRTTLLPALAKAKGVGLKILATSSGASSDHSGRKFGFEECSTDGDTVYGRADVDAVFALTPHSRHAKDIALAAKSRKPLFIEKPLCVTAEELDEIEKSMLSLPELPLVMVGHNRRYSPHTRKICEWLGKRSGPLVLSMRINAGFVPREHWVHSEAQGRSRIVGEMTHFLDLVEVITNARITEVAAMRTAGDDRTIINNDNVIVSLHLSDGSVATIVYSGQGSRSYPREHIEVFSGGNTIVSTDFRQSAIFRASKTEKFSTPSQAYGYEEEIAHFVSAAKGVVVCDAPLTTQIRIMKASFAIERALATSAPVSIA